VKVIYVGKVKLQKAGRDCDGNPLSYKNKNGLFEVQSEGCLLNYYVKLSLHVLETDLVL
jgi:hypothetical protein